ncbi:MAG: hypothetical protein P8Y99_06900 [Calditrichaceae bacterium]
MAKRCLIITYYFPPVGGGGIQRIVKLIKFLNQLDWKFTVLTAENDVVTLPGDQSFLSEIDDTTNIIRIPIKNRKIQSTSGLKSMLLARAGFLHMQLN